MTNVKGGQTAPGFSLNGLDGKSYSLDSLRQKGPVVAAFFKISCPVCQFTFPFLERLYQRYGGDNVTFLGISEDDAKATIGSMGFVKNDLERIATELAERRQVASSPLFRPNESVPANKPG